MSDFINPPPGEVVKRVRDRLDLGLVSPRVGWWLALVLDEALVSVEVLKALEVGGVQVYQSGVQVWLEISLPNGWIDRRILGERAMRFLNANGGVKFLSGDRRKVAEFLATMFPEWPDGQRLSMVVNASRACVGDQLPGPLVGHCLREAPFQLLPQHALWRHKTQGFCPLEVGGAELAPDWDVVPSFQTKDDSSLRQMLHELGGIERAKGSRAAGREDALKAIENLLPIARLEGAAQTLTLLAFGEVIRFGGMRGKLLAPVSLKGYARQALLPFFKMLLKLGLAAEGHEYFKEYESILSGIKNTQIPKAASLLQVLHDRLVLRGAALLPRSLSGSGKPTNPPYAGMVWPHEQLLALDYIKQAGGDSRVQAQARLLILLGSSIPIRTEEFFQLRLVDVCPEGNAYLVNYPRGRDGMHKTPATRMQHELQDVLLLQALFDHKAVRSQEEALPDGVLDVDLHFFGKPGVEHAYRRDDTVRLVSAALRWATGDQRCSVYDLRHTVISARAVAALEQDCDLDVDPWQKMSRSCGHADTDSTRSYVHQLERVLHKCLHPGAGASGESSSSRLHLPALEDRFTHVVRPAILAAPVLAKRGAAQLVFRDMHRLLAGVASDHTVWHLTVGLDLADGCLEQVLNRVRWSWQGLPAAFPVDATTREICHFLTTQEPDSVHARQPKYVKVIQYIETLVGAGDWHQLRAVHAAWRVCVKGHDLDLTCGPMSETLLAFLQRSGISKYRFVAFCNEQDAALRRQLTTQFETVRKQNPRKRRPRARLFLIDAGIDPKTASGATLAMTGFHWLMNVLGVLLTVQGEK